MPVFATIDVGTNSMKLHVAQASGAGFVELGDFLEVTRLGTGLAASGRLQKAAMERNLDQLQRFVEIAREMGASAIAAVGTMALREAANADDFLDGARQRCAIELEVIDGREEARLAFLGAVSSLGPFQQPVLVFDTGGGSTEFILGRGETMIDRCSLNIGVRNSTEELLISDPVRAGELQALQDRLERELSAVDLQADRLIGLGGTVTSLTAVQLGLSHYDPAAIKGAQLGLDELNRQIELYRGLTIEQRKAIAGLASARADVILAGAAIVAAILTRLQLPMLTVSERGLRHGLLQDRFAD